MDITTHVSVESYFHEVVLDALRRARLDASAFAEHYLVALLGAFTSAQITDEPLSLKLAREPADTGERLDTLKQVGDTSLYVSGFFAASLERQLVCVDYYIGLGEAAYRELAARLMNSSASEVYRELAAKFPRFVDVLAEVRARIDCASADVSTLYQQWLHTRSAWIEDRLRGMGVLIGGDDGALQ